jgi:hypothetical protein
MPPGRNPFSSDYEVSDDRDLIDVITYMRADLVANPDARENPTLDRFLEAMAGWLEAFPQSYLNTGRRVPEPDWRFVADVLLAARMYE